MSDTRLVYSTETGRICPDCQQPANQCRCRRAKDKTKAPAHPKDGVVRIGRETKGHGGKTVTVIHGLALDETNLKALAKKLKVRCGTGGTIRDGVIVIQGDHRQILLDEIKKAGYTVKIAGG